MRGQLREVDWGIIVNGKGSQKREPHWLVILILGVVMSLVVGWLGLNDWRFPWVQEPVTSSGRSTAPVEADVLDDGGVDLRWSAVDDDRIDHYDVVVTAVAPISYSYAVPFYPGIAETNDRVYPERELTKNLAGEGRTDRVAAGQLWHVCVTAMMAAPDGVDVAPYTLAGTRSCSRDFTLPK